MTNNLGISNFLAALGLPTVLVTTIALGGSNSSGDGKIQPGAELLAEKHSVASSDSIKAPQIQGISNQHSEQQGGSFIPSFTARDCLELTSPDVAASVLQNEREVSCGHVSVPANWKMPNGNMIDLAVYRVASTSFIRASEPVVVLTGGPGQSGISMLSAYVDGSVSYIRERSEVIVVDQRGTGFSTPSLFCPDAAAIKQRASTDFVDPKTFKAYIAAVQKTLLACAEELAAQNVNLADYTTANNARDIEAIRQALGVDQWNLLGVSYGTTLALTIMRDWPVGVRSAVLDSAVPLQVNLLDEQIYAKGYWPLSRIVENCNADADCHESIGRRLHT